MLRKFPPSVPQVVKNELQQIFSSYEAYNLGYRRSYWIKVFHKSLKKELQYSKFFHHIKPII